MKFKEVTRILLNEHGWSSLTGSECELIRDLLKSFELTPKKANPVENRVMLKLADILQMLDDEEYTVSVHSNDTIDDKISESIANTAIIDFKKQLKQELLSKFSA